MTITRRATMILAALFADASVDAAEPVWRVAPVALNLRMADAIGPKRAGSLCLPAGAIAWRDAKPDEGEARQALVEGLRAGGLPMTDPANPFGDGAIAERAIRAALRGVRLSACVPPSGLGGVFNRSHAIKGDGVVAIGWQAFARGRTDAIASGEVCTTFNYHEDIGSLPRMVLVGVRAAGERVAFALRGEATLEPDDDRCRLLKGALLPPISSG